MKLQNVGIAIGVIGACFSIPKSAYEAWQTMVTRSKVQVYPGPQVTVAYQPKGHLLTCSCPIVVLNSGNAGEIIHTLRAHLGVPGDPSKAHEFDANDIALKESDKEIPEVLLVDQGTSRTLVCEVKATLSEPLQADDIHKLLTADETSRELVMELVGSKKSYQVPFHFDFSTAAEKIVFDKAKDIQLLTNGLR